VTSIDRLRAARAGLATHPVRVAAVGLAGVLAVGGLGLAAYGLSSRPPVVAVASPVPSPQPSPSPSPQPSPSPGPSPSPSPQPSPTPEPASLSGDDGRFTILLLGSDYRPAHPGNRTDVIMVVSIDPVTGQTAAVSIPRDTVRFPMAGGGTYQPKVNGLWQHYVAKLGRIKAGEQMKDAVGTALGVEIDHYAVIGFQGVRELVDAVGGVDVTLAKAYHDPYYWVTAGQRGVSFRAGTNHLDGNMALVFARTRKGDNDFERARRQQLLVAAAVAKVEAIGPRALPDLITIGARWVKTDLPLDRIPEVFRIAAKADLTTDQRVVFGPRTWADGIAGTSSFALKLPAVRDRVDDWMPPVEAPQTPLPAGPGDPPLPPIASQ
jgi:LCP family protein required for cell wall assembly